MKNQPIYNRDYEEQEEKNSWIRLQQPEPERINYKGLFIALLMMAIGLFLIAGCNDAQGQVKDTTRTYTMDKNGKIIATKKATIKTADKVYQVVDGVTFYQGTKGGVYCWKISKKTGLSYKSYLKGVTK